MLIVNLLLTGTFECTSALCMEYGGIAMTLLSHVPSLVHAACSYLGGNLSLGIYFFVVGSNPATCLILHEIDREFGLHIDFNESSHTFAIEPLP